MVPGATRKSEEVLERWERGNREEVCCCFIFSSLCVFAFFFLNFHLQGGGQDREELKGGVHDGKFPKIP